MGPVTAGHAVTVTSEAGVAWVRWHRPDAANAFDETLVEELIEALYRLAADPPAVVGLTGTGGRFCAGFDLTGSLTDRDLGWRFMRAEDLLAAVRAFPGLTVACVEGPAFGLGADVVAACDYRLGDSRARFRFPGPRFGIVLGTHQLTSRVGRARATDVLMRNAVVDADRALDWGLLTDRVEPADQPAWVAKLAADVADLTATTRRELLAILRPALADASAAALGRSSHRDGLGERVEAYRAAALARTGVGR